MHEARMTFDWRNPYPSHRTPLMARNVVATSHPLATQAGLRMLMRGGSAVSTLSLQSGRREDAIQKCLRMPETPVFKPRLFFFYVGLGRAQRTFRKVECWLSKEFASYLPRCERVPTGAY